MGINRVNLTGVLTKNASLLKKENGTPYLLLKLTVDDRRPNPTTGIWQDYPNRLEVKLFGNRAVGLLKYLTIGTKVSIEGRLRSRELSIGSKKLSMVEITAEEIEFWNNSCVAVSQNIKRSTMVANDKPL
ncbi:hypothetical protein FACS1894104_5930 [Actinomycetota bacterium]|nr:hypothetical protein FACS1894104_5930 [Actinomycetota bacterium]